MDVALFVCAASVAHFLMICLAAARLRVVCWRVLSEQAVVRHQCQERCSANKPLCMWMKLYQALMLSSIRNVLLGRSVCCITRLTCCVHMRLLCGGRELLWWEDVQMLPEQCRMLHCHWPPYLGCASSFQISRGQRW